MTKPRELSKRAAEVLADLTWARAILGLAEESVDRLLGDLLKELKDWPNRHVGELLGMSGQAVHQRRVKLKVRRKR